jgi:copper chaperone
LSWFDIASAIAMGLLIAYHVFAPIVARFRSAGERMSGNTQFKVADMTCQHCVRSITTALQPIAGIRGIHADPDTKLVTLDVEDTVDKNAIANAIRDAGYTPEPVG